MLLDGDEEVRKPPEHMRPDRFEFKQAGKADDRELVDRDGEMVCPEMDKPLDEGRFGGERGIEPR
jgi:hypothetical protein